MSFPRRSAALPLPVLLLAGAAAAQLPPVPVPPGNPITAAKVVLGKILFWEEQLSADDTIACGSCHQPESGGADARTAAARNPGPDGLFGTADDVHGTPGVVRQAHGGDFLVDPVFAVAVQVTGRAAPSNLGAAYHAELFWDGRAGSVFDDPETGAPLLPYGGALENQAIAPILSAVEMGRENRTWSDVRQKLQTVQPLRLASNLPADVLAALQVSPGYPDLFRVAFGDPAITAARIALSIASYERTLIPDQTPFDAFQAGNPAALTPNQQAGLNLFNGSARCAACHLPPFFSDDMFHNLGLRPAAEDLGRQNVSGVAVDGAAFKTPSLRNAGLRARLFHDGGSPPLLAAGQVTDPASVLNIYLQGGGVDRSNLDPFLLPIGSLGITTADLLQVLDFVAHGLVDPRAAQGLPPFDHPTLRSTAVPPPLHFGSALPGTRAPQLIDVVPPFVGNAGWRLGLAGGDGVSLALLTYGLQSWSPPLVASGIPLLVGPNADARFFVLQGTAGQLGVATWPVPIPDDPGLSNLPVCFQLFVGDAGAPAGVAASEGVAITLR